jgi:hypothetical protein
MIDPVTLAAFLKTGSDTAVGVYSAKQQAKLQGELALLNAEEQKKLQAQLLKAQDQQSKLALIENAVKNKQRQENLPIYIGIGLLVVGVGVGLYFVLRKK